jgi:hypothetical protein
MADELSTKHCLSRARKLRGLGTKITLAEMTYIRFALCSYENTTESLGIKVAEPTLDYFVIHCGGNDHGDVQVTSLPELLPHNLGVGQPGDYYERCPYRAEEARGYGSVMNC